MADQMKVADDKPKSGINAEKLQQLQKSTDLVRIGGKGTARRKKKVMHHPVVKDDKQLINTLKKLGANPIPGIEEVNLFRDNNTVITIKNPKVQTALACNTFSVAGTAVEKPVSEVMPSFSMNSMNPESLMQLRNLGNLLSRAREGKTGIPGNSTGAAGNDDDVPVPQENFDQSA